MKISFSTLACPDFSWTDIYTMAKDLGFGGIEIRGLGEDIFAVNARPFTDERLPKTLEKLQSLGLEIPCLAAGCALKYKEDFDKNISEIVQYIVLAKKLGTPYIRVLGDRYPQPEGEVDDAFVVDALKLLGVIAQGFNVCLLVETNGVYSDTKRLRELLDKVNMPSVAALWDMHHPYRYAGESPRETVQNLGGLIKYVHVKDSVMVDGRPQFHISLVIDVSPYCDCHGENDMAILPDVGMFASFDPVALDQACADACLKQEPIPGSLLDDNMHAEGFCDHHDHFKNTTPETDWKSCLEHAEKLGIGTMDYELITI